MKLRTIITILIDARKSRPIVVSIHRGESALGLALSYNSSPLWRRGGGEERVHSNLFNQPFRIQRCLLTLLCSTLVACVGVPPGQESAVVTRAQMQMGTLVKITAVARSESVAQAAATAGSAEIVAWKSS